MKATADRSRCMAAGHCAVTAPAVFGNGDDGLVTVLDPEPGPEHREDVLLAQRLCPSGSIRILEARPVPEVPEAPEVLEEAGSEG